MKASGHGRLHRAAKNICLEGKGLQSHFDMVTKTTTPVVLFHKGSIRYGLDKSLSILFHEYSLKNVLLISFHIIIAITSCIFTFWENDYFA